MERGRNRYNIKQGGIDRGNNSNKVKDGEMSAQKVRVFSGRRRGDKGKSRGIEILPGCTKRGNT